MNVKFKPSFRLAKMMSALLCVTGLAACATLPADTPEDEVRLRAKARWAALIAGKVDDAYGYLAPSYRGIRDLAFYRGTVGGGVRWKDVDVVGVECKPEVCVAKVRITFGAGPTTGVFNTHYEEQWVKEDNHWWFYQKP